MVSWFRLVSAVSSLGLILLSSLGCQNSNERAAAYRQFWEKGQYAQAIQQVDLKVEKEVMTQKDGRKVVKDLEHWDSDALLYLLEQGTVHRAAGQYPSSNDAFLLAHRKMETLWERPDFQISRELVALADSMESLDYDGYGYDHVMAMTYMALNYLQAGQLPETRTSLDGAEQVQKSYLEKKESKIEARQKELTQDKDRNQKVESVTGSKEMLAGKKNYESLDALVAQYASYQDYRNPFTTWLYGICLMAAPSGADRVGDLSNAKAAIEIAAGMVPGNQTLQGDLALAADAAQGIALPATTYVIFETGQGPVREEFVLRLPIPTGSLNRYDLTYMKVAFPQLKNRQGHVPYLDVTASGQTSRTESLASMDAIIAREFKDELPLVITRSIISAIFKATATEVGRRAAGGDSIAAVGVLAAGVVYQEVSTRADLRQWALLPKEFQVCRIATPADRMLTLNGPGLTPHQVQIQPGHVNIVYVKSIQPTVAPLVWQAKLN